MNYGRVLRTARHLRWSQIAWRLRAAAQRRFAGYYRSRRPKQLAAVAASTIDPMPPTSPSKDTTGKQLFDELANGQLTCAGMPLAFDVQRPDWRLGSVSEHRLPAVTLHYHRWLFELLRYAEQVDSAHGEIQRTAMRLLDHWLGHCGEWNTQTAPLAWNSYAIATRMEWWSRMLRHAVVHSEGWKRVRDAMVASMQKQAEHLYHSLEWDLRANHLFRDAVGLAWASRTLADPNATKWRRTALRLAREQMREQILLDGFHYERSPMYHIAMMRDIRDIAILLDDREFADEADGVLERMGTALQTILHPDGATPQWNDGSRCQIEEALSQDQPRLLPSGGRWLGHTGWAAWRCDQWFVLFDAGPIGPDEQPGHAHADTLSVECSFQGQRLFVDPGNYHYDNDSVRQAERSTTAHNTVVCDDSDSSEVWHIFRAGRRANVRDARILVSQDRLTASGEHDGFTHLPDQPHHRRHVNVGRGLPLEVLDEIRPAGNSSGSRRHRASGGWLLEPGWSVEQVANGWRLKHPLTDELEVQIEGSGELKLSVEEAAIATDYYHREPAQRLVWRSEGFLPLTVRMQVGRKLADSALAEDRPLLRTG